MKHTLLKRQQAVIVLQTHADAESVFLFIMGDNAGGAIFWWLVLHW